MKIFLSYASEDSELVEPICLALRAQGHKGSRSFGKAMK
jgi:hypothetical protein